MPQADHPFNNPEKNAFVLCFDGTGNKFSGTEADSNILKLYRMLDRSNRTTYTFYQPGIGTYITSHSMQTTSMAGKVRSWYLKAKDSAIGSSFAEHVMGGYKFLMRYYSCEDDLYFFGFSRGAYTARFLAEMLDHIGLLSAGNEELIRFAWKTYAKWASRKNDGSDEAKKEEARLYEFMRGFRETFSRPVRRIRFMGLFDTVNSVPKFESAWMQRSKFPYTARSSAKVIRHAVSMDERRAKFRQDLISGDQSQREDHMNSNIHRYNSDLANTDSDPTNTVRTHKGKIDNVDRMSVHGEGPELDEKYKDSPEHLSTNDRPDCNHLAPSRPLAPAISDDELAGPGHDPNSAHLHQRDRFMSVAAPNNVSSEHLRRQELRAEPLYNENDPSQLHKDNTTLRRMRRQYSESKKKQDIEEVWFAGGHADIGGGWTKADGEQWMLSHAPLVWMVHEAQKAGLQFDPLKVARHNCHPDRVDDYGSRHTCPQTAAKFHTALEASYTTGLIHDCLTTGHGLPFGTVALWKIMEYLPFRRMDLQQDGSWKAIRWPLPMGETRDVPFNAQIHHSVIKRMQSDPEYRPGNLIVGGGGRGVRKAPEKYGMGDWEKYKFYGDPILETYRRANPYPQE